MKNSERRQSYASVATERMIENLPLEVGAVICLEAPDSDQDGRRHTETLLDAVERGLVLSHEGLAAPHEARPDAAGVELFEGELEGLLRAVEPHDRRVVADAGECGSKDCG